jgi:hypothetical protein
MVSPTLFSLRSLLVGCWPKVTHNRPLSRCGPRRSLLITEDMAFKDKDIEKAKAILAEQEAKSDQVDYEFRIWQGNLSSLGL